MSSFRLPENLLHSHIEPQWFPRPREETESGLEILERQETERLERLRRAVLPTPPEPLGFATSDSQSSLAKQRAILQKQNAVDLKTLPPMPRFWDKYATQFKGEDQTKTRMESTPTKVPSSFDAMIESPSPSAASEMDFSRDSSSIFSPTS